MLTLPPLTRLFTRYATGVTDAQRTQSNLIISRSNKHRRNMRRVAARLSGGGNAPPAPKNALTQMKYIRKRECFESQNIRQIGHATAVREAPRVST